METSVGRRGSSSERRRGEWGMELVVFVTDTVTGLLILLSDPLEFPSSSEAARGDGKAEGLSIQAPNLSSTSSP